MLRKMNIRLAFLFLLCAIEVKPIFAAPVFRDSIANLIFEKHIFTSGKDTLRYRLLRPEKEVADKKYPLLLFFHGAGERGNDNELNLVHVPELLTDSAGRKKYPCFIVITQCPLDKRWVEVNWGDEKEIMPKTISITEKLTMELEDSLQKNLAVDSTRLYITGLSMGGFATWDLISRYPEKFAAAAPVCGGGDESQSEKLTHIPIWAFHGELDKTVHTSRSINMVNAVNKCGGNAKITLYENVQHNSWINAYGDPELFEWLFQQHK